MYVPLIVILVAPIEIYDREVPEYKDTIIATNEHKNIARGLLASNPPFTQCYCNFDIMRALREVSVEKEILDETETRYFFVKKSEFESDLRVICARYADLKDVPSLTTTSIIPDYKELTRCVNFNVEFAEKVRAIRRLELDMTDICDVILRENSELYKIYDYMRDAKSTNYNVPCRKYAIKKLIDAIGEENYRDGIFPPNIPTWRFREIK